MTVGLALALIYIALGIARLTLIVYIAPKIRAWRPIHDFNQAAFFRLGDLLGPYILVELLAWPVMLAFGLTKARALYQEMRREERAKRTFYKIQDEPVPGYEELTLGNPKAPVGEFVTTKPFPTYQQTFGTVDERLARGEISPEEAAALTDLKSRLRLLPPDPAAPSVFDSLNFHPDDEAVRPIGCLCLSCRKLRGEA